VEKIMIGGLRKVNPYFLAYAIGMLASSGSVAKAASVEQLEAAMQAMQAQMRSLQRQVDDAKAEASAARAAAKSGGGDDLDLKVKWKGAPELSSKDGKFKFKILGRVQADVVSADQDQAISGAPDISATEIRRARLGVQGVVFSDVKYKFEVDFADNEAELKDAYLTYTGLPVDISLGQFKTYNSLEELTSSRFITFMERAAFTDAFDLERQIGAGLDIKRDHWTVAAGAFGANAGDVASPAGDEGFTFASRLTAAPINNGHHVLHFGGSVRHRDNGSQLPLYRYRQRAADFHLTDRFVDTGFIGEADTFWGAEFAWVWGPFSIQGEYARNQVDVPVSIATAHPTYDGWYVDASWYLTGEMRDYNKAVFSRPKVKRPVNEGGPGAWQIAARYDVIDLSNQAAAIAAGGIVSCAECGEQKTWIFGVNWWLNDYTRLTVNYAQSDISGGVNSGATIQGAGLRAQIDW
jgi:phosphate-selective porin OprO/OprP